MKKERAKAEYGDFQTPPFLARQVCTLLASKLVPPRTIIEPTCGLGHLFFAALDEFAGASRGLALDVNLAYVDTVARQAATRSGPQHIETLAADFFTCDWPAKLKALPEPLLVIGNPPWVTNSELGTLESANLPIKSNFQGRLGLDALTGKSNFDISEWMLLQMFEWLAGKRATLAMLCKTAVARKVLAQAWERGAGLGSAEIYRIDAERHFSAAVEACLLVCDFSVPNDFHEAQVYEDLLAREPGVTIGLRGGQLVADVACYQHRRGLRGKGPFKWRSGVKHDCSRVMELRKEGNAFRNGLEEVVAMEDRFLYPMLKSSELANEGPLSPKRWMLVTQESVGEQTAAIELLAPNTWAYLESHAELLDARRSTIYKSRPRFSIFGVGPYTFAPWKVAISGFYKQLAFRVVGPLAGKPIVLDDTCYFVPFDTELQANFIALLLNSTPATDFFQSLVFWDSKRPITVDLLKQLDLRKVASELHCDETWNELFPESEANSPGQQRLFV